MLGVLCFPGSSTRPWRSKELSMPEGRRLGPVFSARCSVIEGHRAGCALRYWGCWPPPGSGCPSGSTSGTVTVAQVLASEAEIVACPRTPGTSDECYGGTSLVGGRRSVRYRRPRHRGWRLGSDQYDRVRWYLQVTQGFPSYANGRDLTNALVVSRGGFPMTSCRSSKEVKRIDPRRMSPVLPSYEADSTGLILRHLSMIESHAPTSRQPRYDEGARSFRPYLARALAVTRLDVHVHSRGVTPVEKISSLIGYKGILAPAQASGLTAPSPYGQREIES